MKSIKSYFMRSFCFFSVYSAEVFGKVTSIRSKLPTAACQSWEEKRGNSAGANLLYVESDFSTTTLRASGETNCSQGTVPQTPQTNQSQYSSPIEALNLITDSKSQPFELDNSTGELYVPSSRKKSLQSYCSVICKSIIFKSIIFTNIILNRKLKSK